MWPFSFFHIPNTTNRHKTMQDNNLFSFNKNEQARYQRRYQPRPTLNTDTVYYARNCSETLVESQQEGKHGIRNHQLVDTVFNTVFILRMSMNLSGRCRTLKGENPRITGIRRDKTGCCRMMYGGSAWESNPPERLLTPHTGFEVREDHQCPIHFHENRRIKNRRSY